ARCRCTSAASRPSTRRRQVRTRPTRKTNRTSSDGVFTTPVCTGGVHGLRLPEVTFAPRALLALQPPLLHQAARHQAPQTKPRYPVWAARLSFRLVLPRLRLRLSCSAA